MSNRDSQFQDLKLTIVDISDWLSRKLDELAVETIVEMLFVEHPEEATTFEAKAEEIFENDRNHFPRKFDELRKETLEKFYPGRVDKLVSKIRKMLYEEHMTKNLELHSLGRNVFRVQHSDSELLSQTAN